MGFIVKMKRQAKGVSFSRWWEGKAIFSGSGGRNLEPRLKLNNGYIFYQLFCMIPSQPRLLDSKPKELPSLRRKAVKAESIPSLNLDEGVLFSTISLNRQIQSVQHSQPSSKYKQTAHQEEIMLICSNKIYNKKEGTANLRDFAGKCGFRRSLNKVGGEGCGTEEEYLRPRTSAIDKFHQTGDVLICARPLRNDENRPGSSKSSRLFKHKGPLYENSLQQNAQGDSLIRVTSNACSRPKGKSSIVHRSRVATSLSHLQHSDESVPNKIDPTFYRLFAK